MYTTIIPKFKYVLINYAEALSILYNHLHIPNKERDNGLSEILLTLVVSHFSDFNYHTAKKEVRLLTLLDNYDLVNFENSDIGFAVSNSIIRTTNMYLPGFRSYESTHFLQADDITTMHQATVMLRLNEMQFQTFINEPIGFNNARISYI